MLHEIGADELPIELVDQQDRRGRRDHRRRLANRYPDALQVSALTGEGLDELRARIAERFAERFESCACCSRTTRAASSTSCTRSARRSRSARTPTKACSSSPACRAARCRRFAPYLVADERLAVIELPIRRLRDDASCPARAYAGDAGLDLAACERVELGPGSARLVGTGLAVAIPEGYAGFVQPRSGLAARARDHDREHARASSTRGYRGELKVILLNTDDARDVRRRARHAHRAARRRSRCPASSRSRSTSCRRASAACEASARPSA